MFQFVSRIGAADTEKGTKNCLELDACVEGTGPGGCQRPQGRSIHLRHGHDATLAGLGGRYAQVRTNKGEQGASLDAALVTARWTRRSDRYSEQRREQTPGLPKVEMSRIGG